MSIRYRTSTAQTIQLKDYNIIMSESTSTIASMIDRFRHSKPKSRTDREMERTNAKDKFWWTNSKDNDQTPQRKSQRHQVDSDDSSSLEGIDILTPRTNVSEPKSGRSLDDMIAKEVEEMTKAFSVLGKSTKPKKVKTELNTSMESDESNGGEDSLLGKLEPNREDKKTVKPLSLKIHKVRNPPIETAKPKERTVERVPTVVPLSLDTPSPLEIPEIPDMLQRVKQDMIRLDALAQAATDTSSYAPHAIADFQLSEDTSSRVSLAESLSELQAAMSSFRREEITFAYKEEPCEKTPVASTTLVQVAAAPKTTTLNDPKRNPIDATPPKVATKNELNTQTSPDMGTFYDERLAYTRLAKYPLDDFLESDHRNPLDIFPSRESMYRRETSALDVAEDLDAAISTVKIKFSKHDRMDEETESKQGPMETLKQRVHAKLKDLVEGDDMPPLPNDYYGASEILSARERLANAFESVPHGNLMRTCDMNSVQRALLNAFQQRDWNDDGLIDVRDACRIMEEFSNWTTGTPRTIPPAQVLRACGLDLLGPQASRHVTFAEFVQACELCIPELMIESPEMHFDEDSDSESSCSSSGTESINSKDLNSHEPRAPSSKQSSTVPSVSVMPIESPYEISDHNSERSDMSSASHLRDLAAHLRSVNRLLQSKTTITPKRDPGFIQRPPPFNPETRNPSAPPANVNRVEDCSVTVVNLAELEHEIQNATIKYYQEQLKHAAEKNNHSGYHSSCSSSKGSTSDDEVMPVEAEHSRNSSRLTKPRPVSDNLDNSVLSYNGRGRLSVRGHTRGYSEQESHTSDTFNDECVLDYSPPGILRVRPRRYVYASQSVESVPKASRTAVGTEERNTLPLTRDSWKYTGSVTRAQQMWDMLAESRARRQVLASM